VFDIGLLAERLAAAMRWAHAGRSSPDCRSATSAPAPVLWAAAELDDEIGAVVSRSGRPDLAAGLLPEMHAPVLLIVVGRDEIVLGINPTPGPLAASTVRACDRARSHAPVSRSRERWRRSPGLPTSGLSAT